jgi:hypothetical protein
MIRDPLQRSPKTFFHNSKSQSKMLGHLETIARGKQRPALSYSTTEHSRIATALEPRKTNHATARTYPTEFVSPLAKKLIEKLQVGGDNLARAREDLVALAQCHGG